MNCPKCGRELLIGSTLCPDCDIVNDINDGKIPRKRKRKLTKIGKIIIGAFGGVVLLILICILANHFAGYKVLPIENGNGLSGAVAEYVKNEYFYSTGDALYGTNKKIKEHEIIDKAPSGEIYSLVECNKNLYYIKNGVLCLYSPGKRIKKDLVKLPSVNRARVVSKSEYCFYFIVDNMTYRYDIQTNNISKEYDYPALYDGNEVFIFKSDGIYKTNTKKGITDKISDVGEFEIPAFILDNVLYTIDQKAMTVMAVSKKTGEKKTVFDCKEHTSISDVAKLNTDGEKFYLVGSDGVYTRGLSEGLVSETEKKGFVNAVAISKDKMFCRDAAGNSYICDLNGKILYEINHDDIAQTAPVA